MNLELAKLGTLAVIHLLALLSPGPDFFLVLKNSLSHSRKIGLYTALGLGIGILFHVSYSLTGIKLLLIKYPKIFEIVQYVGGAYLIYLGFMTLKSLIDDFKQPTLNQVSINNLSLVEAIRMGTLTNILNPKAGLYFISIFSQFITSETSTCMKVMMGVEVIILTTLYFAVIAIVLTHNKTRSLYDKARRPIEGLLGVSLIVFGIKVLAGF